MVEPVFLPETMVFGPGDGDKPKDPINDELKKSYKNVMRFDNRPAIDVIKSAATKSGVNPALLFSSAYQEGMNKAILKPDEVSEAFLNAEKKGLDTKNFPVDGFYNYGLDTFADKYQQLKKYLPAGFESEFKPYKATNEVGQPVTTAAFKNNESALMAKAAMLKLATDEVNSIAKEKGVKINPEDMDYFTLARYNASAKNLRAMIDEYGKAKDKRAYIDNGQTAQKNVHNNIYPRLARMKLVNELLGNSQ